MAHTAPVYVRIPGCPMRPRREEVDYRVGRMKEQIEANKTVRQAAELDTFRQALGMYEEIEVAGP